MDRKYLFTTAIIIISIACASFPINLLDGVLPEQIKEQGTPASGSLIFEDDFSSPQTGWDRLMVNQGMMDYDGGGYRILVNALQTNFWSSPHKDFDDVRMEVDVGKLGGPDENRAGLICRMQDGNYYFFIFTSDGYFGVGIFSSGQAVLLGGEELQFSEKILQGMTVNHLRADCQGDRLAMFINGFEAVTVHDSSLKSGDIGLVAGTFAQPGVDIIFDNLVVLKP